MSLYPRTYGKLVRHWAVRFAFFLLGIVLLYAPFALLTRLVVWATGSPLVADVHRICMRMPIQWLGQPWMYRTMLEQPAYLGSVLVLPAVAFFVSPLFCGWLCPAGGLTEYLSRLVPPRFQINLAGRLNPVPVRYGFTLGMIITAFVGGNACCSFCNFTHTQNIISAIFGDPLGISYWASFLVVGFVLWFFILGLFTRGGRGWCSLLCPAGALMGLAHWAAAKLGLGRGVQIKSSACRECQTCVAACPTWAISAKEGGMHINRHGCNGCLDCTHVCEHGALAYGRNSPVSPS